MIVPSPPEDLGDQEASGLPRPVSLQTPVPDNRNETGIHQMEPIQIPDDWDDNGVIVFEEAYRCGKRAIRIRLDDLEATPRQIPSARWWCGGTWSRG